ncbi:putative membrane protein [Candidatus Protochlamydia naegleriophila]|uniref:Putative membrane protein n=1 Tax=Candidatus Protochlamydia naegleriophila TaxID=389348 RepID=A0A0U5JFU6_9BACT|nr:hypothetical protein [Candidatus Protochlamydia naegleriophila]CUI17706.1 putative membrane protein [Candidatus Protochlamydia naegleriophila]
MLKLEKCIHSYRINVCIREKDTFFTPLLVKSLAFALTLHLVAVVIFHIQPFKLTTSFLYPPVQVETENKPFLAMPLFVMQAPAEEISFSPPPSSIESLYSPLLHPPSSSEQLLALTPIPSPSFLALEQRHWPIAAPSLAPVIERAAIRLFTSGDLASHSLISQDPRLGKSVLLAYTQEPAYITYQVRLDESGTVFWYDRIQSSASKEANNLTEQILLDAKFLPSKPPAHASGWLHFVVYEQTH